MLGAKCSLLEDHHKLETFSINSLPVSHSKSIFITLQCGNNCKFRKVVVCKIRGLNVFTPFLACLGIILY